MTNAEIKIFVLTIVLNTIVQVGSVVGQTFCNPLSLPFPTPNNVLQEKSLTDPTIVLFQENYFLFATNAGGYWYSGDLISWKFVTASNLPLEKRAPAAFVIDDWIYFCTSFDSRIYRSKDPKKGEWEIVCDNSLLLPVISDFAIFVDTDKRVYCYYGCSNKDGVMVRELDPNDRFNPVGIPVECRKVNPLNHSQKQQKTRPSVGLPERDGTMGSWMNKYGGKYYYQCAESTLDAKYMDVVYVADNPRGPFVFAENNPFSFRPEGSLSGGGIGCTFADKYGNWWHVAVVAAAGNQTATSIALFPAGFDKDGNLYSRTDFGDYPIILPTQKWANIEKLYPEWALLSDQLSLQASSNQSMHPATAAADGNSSTFWSAQSGKSGEWLLVDLGSECVVNALQLNFAVNNAVKSSAGNQAIAFPYVIETSGDKKNWQKLSDKSANTDYSALVYEEFKKPVLTRYLKITNSRDQVGSFAVSELRVFGKGTGRKPKKVNEFRVVRDYRNPQIVKMSWKKQPNAAGYNIRYGTDKDKMYHSYQVSKKTRVTIYCPDRNKSYWFQMDAFNENGITPGKAIPLK